MSYEPDRKGGRCGCIAALPVMFMMRVLFLGSTIGDCSDDAQCIASKRQAALLLWITPLSGIATFFLIRWLVGRRK